MHPKDTQICAPTRPSLLILRVVAKAMQRHVRART